MPSKSSQLREREFRHLLDRDHSLYGGVLFGIDGYIIEIQARAMHVHKKPTSWRASTEITGMATGAMRECLSRIEGAFRKLKIPDSDVEILINLAPADLPKDGVSLDLPIAIIMLQAAGQLPDLPEEIEPDFILMGELGIHGEVRRVPGALSIAFQAKPKQKLIVPSGNDKECALILAKPGHEDCGVFPVSKLEEVVEFFKGKSQLANALKNKIEFEDAIPRTVDFGKIKGQEKAKRAAIISAAGGHNLLLVGPPGEGKSLLASALPGILPPLSSAEKVELTRIYSACGKLDKDGMAVTRRPMRSVHHSASVQSILGGGSGVPRPGEITLSHLGVLFLDEFTEFNRGTIENLRQPIENGEVVLNRVNASLTFPCNFTLVAAMNPCPCGYYGYDKCVCNEQTVLKYLSKVSGPILDRIDLQVDIEPLSTDERFQKTEEGVSKKIRGKVLKARKIQDERFNGSGVPYNAAIPGGHVVDYCDFSDEGLDSFKTAVDENSLSTRTMDRLAKVSRTIADLEGDKNIYSRHLSEAKNLVLEGKLKQLFN